jgi:uncharacterized protein YecT (DUF1311 family)
LGLGLVLLTAPGAAPVLAQALDAPCANAPNNVAYKDCLNRLSAQADQELDQVWKRVVEKIEHADYPGPKQRKAWEKELSDAQRDWLSFRQKDCGAVLYEYWGGSGAGGFMTLCQLKHTRDRIKHLRARYDISGTAGTPSYPFLGRWATKPEGQTQSLSEICKQQSFGHLEITASKVMAYESDCDIKSIEKDGKKFHIQSACFAEGEDFSEIMTIEMRDDGKMHVVERIPKWGQKTTQVYRRCP